MKSPNSDQANLKLLGQAIQFFWSSGAVKSFFPYFVLVLVIILLYSFWLPPWITFGVTLLIVILCLAYLLYLLPKRPELFQDGGVWLGYQKSLLGSKGKGMADLTAESSLLQPISQQAASTLNTEPKVVEVKK